MKLRRCLHITNPAIYEHIQKENLEYDKLRQVHWFVDEIHCAYMREWSSDKFLTINKMMVRYKGSYCPICQYMPKKPKKWGIKSWVLADLVSKFIYYFKIYYQKNLEVEVRVVVSREKSNVAYRLVIKLLQGLKEKEHCIIIDNYFCCIMLFKDFVSKGIYVSRQ
jgi:hypothetical protein